MIAMVAAERPAMSLSTSFQTAAINTPAKPTTLPVEVQNNTSLIIIHSKRKGEVALPQRIKLLASAFGSGRFGVIHLFYATLLAHELRTRGDDLLFGRAIRERLRTLRNDRNVPTVLRRLLVPDIQRGRARTRTITTGQKRTQLTSFTPA